MKYIFAFFYRNNLDLLRLAIQSIEPLWAHTIIFDNTPHHSLQHEQPFPPGVHIYPSPTPLSFTQSMNLLLQMGQQQGADAVIFMHNDAEAHPHTASTFISALTKLKNTGANWGITCASGFLLFAINVQAVGTIGYWDTTWPDYFSDVDFCYRTLLAGYDMYETNLPITHHNGGSNTIKSDPQLHLQTLQLWPEWEAYYAKKWGGPIGSEVYNAPFNPAATAPCPRGIPRQFPW
ncbi:hypothetical protein BVG16_05530 [Paenibacillus selenitireducens]|uniref:Glycosyltransferase n=1 Tax=Paenibacillus selenitireducens TaxID=1324314 RepID=A0A1T2XK32_9BACL|nr:hypothetical protein [Paenibacillus selenitireducens]OPA80204.1 hypothetical protein BVG16_05530 [Paenibacillus selenitireducens]